MKQVRLAGSGQTMRSVCLECFSSWTTQQYLATLTFRDGDYTHSGGELTEYWSLSVSGNWRIIFRFIGSDIELVDYLDYH